jgi:tetratricopeptide (TPR) repeat protein
VANEEGRAGRSAAWGVAAVVFAAGAIAAWQVAVAPKSSFPILPVYVLGLITLAALYMCFATMWDWWPAKRSRVVGAGARAVPTAKQAGSEPSSSTTRESDDVAGPREAAIEAERLLTALDDTARGLGNLDGVLNSLLERTERDGQHDERRMGRFRRRIEIRGIDPRLLIPQLPDHTEAVRRWLSPLQPSASDDDDADSLAVLGSYIRAFKKELSGRLSNRLSAPSQGFLDQALSNESNAKLSDFLLKLSGRLPPLRSTSVALVPFEPSHAPERASTDSSLPAQYRPYRYEIQRAAKEICSLPYNDSYMVGRDKLVSTIVRAVHKHTTRRRAAKTFLSGQPGVGTSTVAIEVARKLIPDFPDGVLYIDLYGLEPEKIRKAPTAARIISEALAIGSNATAISDDQLVAHLIAQLADKRALLVFDNALDSAHVAPLTDIPPTCGIIVTSRDSLQSYADPDLIFGVPPLRRKAAITVLARFSANHSPKAPALANLAKLCGYVPLALRILGARIAMRPGLDVSYLVHTLEKELSRLDYLQAGDRAVRATIQLSYDSLDPASKQILRLISAAPGFAVTAGELSHCLDDQPSAYELILNRLADRNLAEQTLVGTSVGALDATFELFELVRLYAHEKLLAEEEGSAILDFQKKSIAYLRDHIAGMSPIGRDLFAHLDPVRYEAAMRLAEKEGWLDLADEVASELFKVRLAGQEVDSMLEISMARTRLQLLKGDHELAARLCLDDAEQFLRLSASDQASNCIERALKISADHHLPLVQAQAHFTESVLLGEQSRWARALTVGKLAASELKELGREWAAYPIAINNFKFAYELSDNAEALRWSRYAEELTQASNKEGDKAEAAFDISRAEAMAGNYSSAIKYARKAAASYAGNGDWSNAAISLSNAARWARDNDNTVVELQSLEEAVNYLQRTQDVPRLLGALMDLSAAHARGGNLEAASSDLMRAESALKEAEPDISEALRNELTIRVALMKEVVISQSSRIGQQRFLLAVTEATGRAGESVPSLVYETFGLLEFDLNDSEGDQLSDSEGDRRDFILALLSSNSLNTPSHREWFHHELGEEPPARRQLTSNGN